MAKAESFSLLYLNPPNDSEIGSVGNSRMERLFLEHTFRWLVMEGVLVMRTIASSPGATSASQEHGFSGTLRETDCNDDLGDVCNLSNLSDW